MDIAAGFDAAPARKLAVCLAPAGLLVGGLIALLAHGTPQTSGGLVSASPPTKAKARVAQAYGKLPLRFEQNIGQSDPRVKFLSRGAAHSLFLTPREAVLSLSRAGPPVPGAGPPRAKGQGASAVVRMRPVGASPHVRLTASERLPGVSNYLRGKDPRAWQTGVPGYGRVSYQGVYPGIDLVYHGAQGKLEYDFVVSPGADPGRIALSLTGARKLSLDRRGDLILHTAAGHLRQQRPIVYQRAGGKQTRVAGRYVLQGKDRVAFSLGA